MKRLLGSAIFTALFLLAASTTFAAASAPDQSKEYLEELIAAVCGIGPCDKTLYPANPEDASEIIQGSVYMAMNSNYGQIEKFNAPLKGMGIESALLVPPKMVADAVCKYYGYSIDKYPELQKAVEEKAPNGFYVAGIGDPGVGGYSVKKVEILKNGLLRARGTIYEDDDTFRAYFAKTSCGGKPHWALLRVVSETPNEEAEYFNINMQ